MITIKTVELLLNLLTRLIAYVFCVTTAGYLQAWAAKKLGDDTPEYAGFLTWNPFMHIDPIGGLFMLLLGFGWGKFIPINPLAVRGHARLLLLFLSQSLSYLGIAFLSLLVLLRIFGLKILTIAMSMVLYENISLSMLSTYFPHSSSFALAIALLLVMVIYLSVLLAVLNLIIGGFRFAFSTFLEHLARSPEGELLTFVVPLLIMMIFSPYLRVLVVQGISICAYWIAPLIGVS